MKVLAVFFAVLAAFAGVARADAEQSFLLNGDFRSFPSGDWGNGSTTTTGILFADHWYFGPGENAVGEFYRYPDQVILHWASFSHFTSDPNDPSGGQTFVETLGLDNMTIPLSGTQVCLTLTASTRWVDFPIAMILWSSWDTTTATDYQIVACPPVTLTATPQSVRCTVRVPPVNGRRVNTKVKGGNYVGVGIDMLAPPPAPFSVVLYGYWITRGACL